MSIVTKAPSVPHLARRPGKRVTLGRHPATPDERDVVAVRSWVQRQCGLTAIDLFAGAGGLSLGLEWAGFSVLVGADHDPFAAETHAANIAGLTYTGDLQDPTEFLELLSSWGIDHVDLLAGGPPCQPFSRAGQSKLRSLVETGARDADDPRAHLWTSYVEIVRALEPSAVLMENVPDLASWNEGAVLTEVMDLLRALGYGVEPRVLAASAYGVPQHRQRLILVGVRDGFRFTWPEPSQERVTLWDAIGDLPEVAPDDRVDPKEYTGPAASEFAQRMRRTPEGAEPVLLFDHITRAVRTDDAEAFALLPEGGTYRDLPARLQRYRTDIFTDKYKRLVKDAPSRTITAHLAKDGYWYIHPVTDRTLSIREAARIQTFPDSFRFAGTPTHRYRQIGNAVPPLLGEAVGVALRDAIGPGPQAALIATAGDSRRALEQWHGEHARAFPWRGSKDPWVVLMAEMCLRRTRAEQVARVFPDLVELAPTPEALIDHEVEVGTTLASLGLRWRVDNLVDAARVITDVHSGQVPDSAIELMALPGVGDYVAQAVLCFGFGRRGILIDTNTSRIVSRVYGQPPPSRRWQTRLDLLRLAGSVGPDAAFNYALLDLGALVCRPRSPHCSQCPFGSACTASTAAVTRDGEIKSDS